MGMGTKRNIYYLDITMSYKKGKSVLRKETWAVSKYDTPQDIMRKDPKTMSRLDHLAYGLKYKSIRQLVITKILSKKIIGRSQIID